MALFKLLRFVCVTILCITPAFAGEPRSTDPEVTIELFAEQPQVVTPTGLAVDSRGRVFVGESHTHFRPDNYDGPKADRILILEDTNGDGLVDRTRVFHEGFTHLMDLAFHRDGSLYVATRKDIHRMEDTDGDHRADKITKIIDLETNGNYPHNGISGLAFHINDRLSFGLGENLGASYAIVGTDGTRFSGGGEGGSTYQVDSDGKNLTRISTGWWNPFGMCVDAFDRVFGTDNDPGASPPCRLHQVIPGGDYGYEYRYGRTGLHPLISWTGSNPGNLPMISGTGEAPCAVLAYESDGLPKKYLGQLFVASWADHRIERYQLAQPKTQGLVTTKREILIEADDDFRPVDLAIAPDGTVYVTDWVSSSYTLHKQGRIWRIRSTKAQPQFWADDPKADVKSPHRDLRERAARALVARAKANRKLTEILDDYLAHPRARSAIMQAWAAQEQLPMDDLVDWLPREADVRLQQLGVQLLGARGMTVPLDRWNPAPSISVKAHAVIAGSWQFDRTTLRPTVRRNEPLTFHALVMSLVREKQFGDDWRQYLWVQDEQDYDWAMSALLLAQRRRSDTKPRNRDETIRWHLKRISPRSTYLAIKWIADERLTQFRPQLVKLLGNPELSYQHFRATAATIDLLDGKKISDHPSPGFLLSIITGKTPATNLLRLALREIDPGFKGLKFEHLQNLVSHPDEGVRLEAVRTLTRHPSEEKFSLLTMVAKDETASDELRATAIAGLVGADDSLAETLIEFATASNEVLRDEALRSLVGLKLDGSQLSKLQSSLGDDHPAVTRLENGSVGQRPSDTQLSEWKTLLNGPANANAGRRIFFGQKVGTCWRCHQIDGRGIAVGPDLTQIDRRLELQGASKTDWLLKTILRPSEDMAPQYTPWTIVTMDGRTLTGLPRRKGGNSEAYLGVDGKEFSVRKPDIEFHKESDVSLMPKDLLINLTQQELRDLFAFLMSRKDT